MLEDRVRSLARRAVRLRLEGQTGLAGEIEIFLGELRRPPRYRPLAVWRDLVRWLYRLESKNKLTRLCSERYYERSTVSLAGRAGHQGNGRSCQPAAQAIGHDPKPDFWERT